MKWVQIQHRTFAKWVSQHTGSKIENFKVDFIDGTIFLRLMEVLAGKSVKRYHMFPQSITQRCDNVQLALDICSSEDVKLTNIGAQDIAGGSLKLILGLVWCLIQRYHLTSIYDKRVGGTHSGGPGLKNNLIRGLNKVLDKVKLRVNNIRDDWRDGMALTALVTYLAPAFNRDFMNIERGDYISATDDAMAAAQAHLNIPRLLSAEDFTSDEVDELSMITYLSYFLDPVHRSVREAYLKEHPEYVPLYKPYIEPEVPETKTEKESPIKKLFSSYKEKLKKVRPSIADTKFYKEPYQIDSKERLSGSKERLSANNGSVGSPKNQRSISSSEPYQTFSRSKESLLLDRRTPSPSSISSRGSGSPKSGSGSPRSFLSRNKESKAKAPDNRTAQSGGSLIRHHKTIKRTEKSQCDKTSDKTCDNCSKSCVCEDPKRDTDSPLSGTTGHTDDELDVSDSERDEILEQIFGAKSVEDLTKDDDSPASPPQINRFKRANTMVIRNRPQKAPLKEALSESESELRPFFRDHEILAEYKLLCNNVSSGVYVVPSLRSIQVWNGVIFIKIGMFAEGCFKFNLNIPDDFPYSRPSVNFTTPVFHPQINEHGELNLTKAFPTWTPRKDRIWHLLRYAKRCFFSVNTFDATNSAAAASVQDSIENYRQQAKLCVLESVRLNYKEEENIPKDDGSVFSGKFLNDTQLQIVKDKLYKGNLDYSLMFN